MWYNEVVVEKLKSIKVATVLCKDALGMKMPCSNDNLLVCSICGANETSGSIMVFWEEYDMEIDGIQCKACGNGWGGVPEKFKTK